MSKPGLKFVWRYLRHPATCVWVLHLVPADEPYTPPPPGAMLRDYWPPS